MAERKTEPHKLLETFLLADSSLWDDKDAGRLAAMSALASVLTYCDTVGISESATRPLTALYAALNDLQRGSNPPMLQREKTEGRPPKPAGERLTEIWASVALDYLIKHGTKKNEAARTVASTLKRRGLDVPAKTINNWRDYISGGDRQSFETARYYQWCEILAECDRKYEHATIKSRLLAMDHLLIPAKSE